MRRWELALPHDKIVKGHEYGVESLLLGIGSRLRVNGVAEVEPCSARGFYKIAQHGEYLLR